MKKVFEILENECWWGGSVSFGDKMPFTKETTIKIDLRGVISGQSSNQHMPFLLSNKGRYIWSDEGLAFEFKNGRIYAEGDKNIDIYVAGQTLKDAYLTASKNIFRLMVNRYRKNFLQPHSTIHGCIFFRSYQGV